VIFAALWLWIALLLFLLEGWLVQVGAPRVDFAASITLYLGLFARVGWLPVLVLTTALARSVLVPGDTALHFLILGIPVGVMVPLRRLFARHDLLLQVFCAFVVGWTQPKLCALLSRAFALDVPVLVTSWRNLAVVIVLAPVLAFLLRKLPPLSRFVERSE